MDINEIIITACNIDFFFMKKQKDKKPINPDARINENFAVKAFNSKDIETMKKRISILLLFVFFNSKIKTNANDVIAIG